MLGELDRVLDAELRAGRSWRTEIEESLERWPRIAEADATSCGGVRGWIEFHLGGDGSALLAANLELELGLICQRCLNALSVTVPMKVRMALGEETGAPEGYEAYGQVGGATVRQLLEDELLLEVPGFPVHPAAAECGPMGELVQKLAPGDGGDETKTNPFAALASLKIKK